MAKPKPEPDQRRPQKPEPEPPIPPFPWRPQGPNGPFSISRHATDNSATQILWALSGEAVTAGQLHRSGGWAE